MSLSRSVGRGNRAPDGSRGGDSLDWRSRGACVTEDPELFFPVGAGGPAQRQIAEAISVCRRCVVRETCLDWAVEQSVPDGVYGGMTHTERIAVRRRAARQARKEAS